MAYLVAASALVLVSYALSRVVSWALGLQGSTRRDAAGRPSRIDPLTVASIAIAMLSMASFVVPLGTLAGAVIALALGMAASRRATADRQMAATIGVILGGTAIVVGLLAYAFALELAQGPL